MSASRKTFWLVLVSLYLAVFLGGTWAHEGAHASEGAVSESQDCGVCHLVTGTHSLGLFEPTSLLILEGRYLDAASSQPVLARGFSFARSARGPPSFLS